jgi:hypothetical protein
MKLYNVIKKLIFEASTDEITNAIKNKNLVTIYYDGVMIIMEKVSCY